MSTEGRLVVWKNRIFIPEESRRNFVVELHKGHQGITRTLQNARQSVYWHGITKDVETICRKCKPCQELRPSAQKETLEADDLTQRPFDVIYADLFYSGGKVLMIFADRLSRYTMVEAWAKGP